MFWEKIHKNPIIHIGHYLYSDIHSHLLPGIDDGSPNLVTSLTLIKGLADLGYKKLFITPHIKSLLFPNNYETIQNAYNRVKEILENYPLQIELYFAAEYYLDHEFLVKLKNENLISFGSQYVLVETSFVSPFSNLNHLLFEIQLKGYKPILAHPERYRFETEINTYKKLKEDGCLLQVNILSFSGYYGKSAKRMANILLENDLIDFLGSDLHHEKALLALQEFTPSKKLLVLLEKGTLLNREI